MRILIYIAVLSALITAAYLAYERIVVEGPEEVMCTTDTMPCEDGSFVGRVAPTCEFEACPVIENGLPDDLEAHIAAKADLIKLQSPEPFAIIESPLTVTGEARGYWFFEASFPVILVDWDGLIIAEGVATADGDWMTEDFVPFSATLTFTKPAYGNNGALILKKDNPSGLPENDDALEIPIKFGEDELIVQ